MSKEKEDAELKRIDAGMLVARARDHGVTFEFIASEVSFPALGLMPLGVVVVRPADSLKEIEERLNRVTEHQADALLLRSMWTASEYPPSKPRNMMERMLNDARLEDGKDS